LYEFILSELEDVEFQTPVYKTIFDTFKENLKKGHVLDAGLFYEKWARRGQKGSGGPGGQSL
jgi:hypothetical protein